MTENNKISTTVFENRVKFHLFEPSSRKIWTIVGKAKEHWLDPDFHFCSCTSFFFNNLDGIQNCYHLEALKLAIKKDKFEIIKFSDDEFEDFLSSLILEL